jgi:hypothetical protein
LDDPGTQKFLHNFLNFRLLKKRIAIWPNTDRMRILKNNLVVMGPGRWQTFRLIKNGLKGPEKILERCRGGVIQSRSGHRRAWRPHLKEKTLVASGGRTKEASAIFQRKTRGS